MKKTMKNILLALCAFTTLTIIAVLIVVIMPAECPSNSADFCSQYAAAQQGDAQAQHMLGFMYEDGEGVAKDKRKAASWFRKAGYQGHLQVQSALDQLY